MSLDNVGLQIIIDGGNPEEARLASLIKPVREKGNLLLCTLLLGNVAVNALLAILMANISNATVKTQCTQMWAAVIETISHSPALDFRSAGRRRSHQVPSRCWHRRSCSWQHAMLKEQRRRRR